MKRFACHIINNFPDNMRFGRLLAVTVILPLLMLHAACGALNPEEAAEIEYTDVEYSDEGRQVTLYLDGIGVPKTKTQRDFVQRAMTKDLATMAYNYIEVVFVSSGAVARAAWELGETAGIDGIARGTAAGIDYSAITSAAMFVGNKDSKVLLGVGKLSGVVKPGTGGALFIGPETKTVTFSLSALQSGLKYQTPADSRPGVATSSFSFMGMTSGDAIRETIGGVEYPMYRITDGTTTAPVTATYAFTFMGTPSDYTPAIKHIKTAAVYPLAQKRTPRYPDSAGYREPRSYIDTGTRVEIPGSYATDGGAFAGSVSITFTPDAKKGIFAFHLQIPVYMVTKDPATNGGPGYETWFIRTGVGSEFYSLDDGISRGGCVLISVGINSLNGVEWTWFKEF